ncbi:MAG: hypothetical protein IJ882_03260 [Paludibacteraceae bacterium]|nr:hypothetical protein [Paludibacteraceae bacterium]
MIGLLMPEVVLYNTLNNIVKVLREDLKENIQAETEENSILYRILGVDENGDALKLNFYNIYKQAKKILTVKDNLKVHYGYSLDTTTAVDICILLPSENGKIGIGADEGYLVTTEEDGYQNYNTQVYESSYQLMVTSNNANEVLLVYTLLKSTLLMIVDQLELAGLRNLRLSGQDIVMQDDLAPVPLFHKVLNMDFMYEHNVPQMAKVDFLKKFGAQGCIVYNGENTNFLEPGAYAKDKAWVEFTTTVGAYSTDYSADSMREQMKKIWVLKPLF